LVFLDDRYDQLAASLSTPGVVALLSAWGPQLQQLHANAAAAHDPAIMPAAAAQQQQQQLSLLAFLEVLQDKGVIPQLLEPADVQEVLRQLLVTQTNQASLGSCLQTCSASAYPTRATHVMSSGSS
jgi:hypothetical protein